MVFFENKLTLKVINKKTLLKIRGGSITSISDEDAIGNQMRPRTAGIGGLMRPKSNGG